MVDNFLNAKYDDFELQILMDCKRKSKFFVCIFILFTEVTVLSYACTPLIENLSRNESDKAFPFRMWIKSIPLQETPYYEICYTVQAVSVYMVGRTYFSLDNILCIINLHLAGQFRMLQYRLSEKYTKNQKKNDESRNLLDLANNATDIFKSCIRQHQALVEYCEEVDAVFSPCVLIQVLAFSIFICLDGYQMLLVDIFERQIIFVFHFLGTVCQLVMFSYSCDCIIRESELLATAAFSGPWLQLPSSKRIENLKKDFIMLIMRSYKSCYISGLGFFIVSLETSTRVLTTAGSYFTLLQETQTKVD
nr:PREDICTED: odorant receptor 49b-like [Megachile rotundata]